MTRRSRPFREVRRKAARVTHEGDALAVLAQPPRLLHGQPGLARARPIADLHPPYQLGELEEHALLLRQPVCQRISLGGETDDVGLRESSPTKNVSDDRDVLLVGHRQDDCWRRAMAAIR